MIIGHLRSNDRHLLTSSWSSYSLISLLLPCDGSRPRTTSSKTSLSNCSSKLVRRQLSKRSTKIKTILLPTRVLSFAMPRTRRTFIIISKMSWSLPKPLQWSLYLPRRYQHLLLFRRHLGLPLASKMPLSRPAIFRALLLPKS